jgi:Na+/H+-translocating membrane pyrophosphatase
VEIGLILIISTAAILFPIFLGNNVQGRSTVSLDMQTISNAIKVGAETILPRQNKTIGTQAIAASALNL